MSQQSNHHPESLDADDTRGPVHISDAIRDAIAGVLMLHGFDSVTAVAVGTMSAACTETNLARVQADAAVDAVSDEPPPF